MSTATATGRVLPNMVHMTSQIIDEKSLLHIGIGGGAEVPPTFVTDTTSLLSQVDRTDGQRPLESDNISVAQNTILEFLHRTAMFDVIRPFEIPLEIISAVRNAVNSWGIDIDLPQRILDNYIDCAIDLGHAIYSHTSYDVQISVSLYTLCSLLFDDGVVGRDAAREFVPRLALGKPQLHPILEQYVQCTLALRNYLPLYGANALITATLDFANFELLRSDETHSLDLKPGALDFIEYARQKDGFAEGFVAAIWPKSDFPDVKSYIQAFADVTEFMSKINDLFSFYKEAKTEEQRNYVNQYAMVHGKSPNEAVVEIMERVILLVERIRGTLGEGKEREAFESFAVGCVRFHIYNTRYRLREVLPMFF
ncbi:terpenoid synthase [Panus rudis PR-1116 ss-1]|nr:terpenoid synthase [Panus rudis PR-1116 ss-1]